MTGRCGDGRARNDVSGTEVFLLHKDRHRPDSGGARRAVSTGRHNTALSRFARWFGALVG